MNKMFDSLNDVSTPSVGVLDKAIHILNIIGSSETPLSLSEITRRSGYTKTTTFRILKCFLSSNYISANDHLEYSLGSHMAALGAIALKRSVARIGYDIAYKLFEDTSQTICICALSEFNIIYLQRISPTITIKQEVGNTRPAHCTALGKCLLAYLPEEYVRSLIHKYGLVRLTENSICDEEKLIQELRSVRRNGYAVNMHEANIEVDAVAAPIFNYKDECVFSISVTVIRGFSDKDILDFIPQVKEAARLISRRLGASAEH